MCEYIAIIVIIVMIIYYLYNKYQSEDFSNKQDKSLAIYNWFRSNIQPTYKQYKQVFKGSSNIVEYEDIMSLAQNKNLSPANIQKLL